MTISNVLWRCIGDFVSALVLILSIWIIFLILADEMYLDIRLVGILTCCGIALKYLYARYSTKY